MQSTFVAFFLLLAATAASSAQVSVAYPWPSTAPLTADWADAVSRQMPAVGAGILAFETEAQQLQVEYDQTVVGLGDGAAQALSYVIFVPLSAKRDKAKLAAVCPKVRAFFQRLEAHRVRYLTGPEMLDSRTRAVRPWVRAMADRYSTLHDRVEKMLADCQKFSP